jgi:curved DNA-binding protein
VSKTGFIDYYEALQLSSNADIDTIERVYRHLAKKFHPDNTQSGDKDQFELVLRAYETLSNHEKRASYDVKYQEYWNQKWGIASEASGGTAIGDDLETRESLLSLMYIQRRRNMRNPGIGDYDMARLLCKPIELVEFHVWYLKAKGWVERTESGQLAISALGVDEVEKKRPRGTINALLPAPESPLDGPEEEEVLSVTKG